MEIMNARDDRTTMHDGRPPVGARSKAAAHDREITAALRSVAALHELAPAVIARLAAVASRQDLARGEQLFGADAHCPGLYIVASGRLMLRVGTPESGHKVIRLAEAGDVIGLSATLLGIDTFASAEAFIYNAAGELCASGRGVFYVAEAVTPPA